MLERFPKTLNSFLLTFPWIHMAIGLAGNVFFVIGSVLFLLNMSAAVFFVLGSVGMLIGSAGYLLVEIKTRGLRNRGYEPHRMATLRKSEIDAARVARAAGSSRHVGAESAREDGSGPTTG